MQPMKWKNFLLLIGVMGAVALFFHYLNGKPENIMNHVILGVRRIGDAHARKDAASEEGAKRYLDDYNNRLKTDIDRFSNETSEAETFAASIVERLIVENVETLENAPVLPSDKDPVGQFQRQCDYVNVTHALLTKLIREWAQHLPPDKFKSIADRYEERLSRATSRLSSAGTVYTINRH